MYKCGKEEPKQEKPPSPHPFHKYKKVNCQGGFLAKYSPIFFLVILKIHSQNTCQQIGKTQAICTNFFDFFLNNYMVSFTIKVDNSL